MEEFEIHFDDLNEEAQKRYLKYLGIENASEANLDVFPIAIANLEDD